MVIMIVKWIIFEEDRVIKLMRWVVFLLFYVKFGGSMMSVLVVFVVSKMCSLMVNDKIELNNGKSEEIFFDFG